MNLIVVGMAVETDSRLQLETLGKNLAINTPALHSHFFMRLACVKCPTGASSHQGFEDR